MLRYEPELETLSFKVISLGDLSKAETRQYLDDKKAKHVRVDEVYLTLRSLVSSTLSFDNTPRSTGDSCTIAAAAVMYVAKDGSGALSNGNTAEAGMRVPTSKGAPNTFPALLQPDRSLSSPCFEFTGFHAHCNCGAKPLIRAASLR
jgi:hypothetical protein